MKTTKKLLSILMVLTLVLSLGAFALADGAGRLVNVTIGSADGLPNTHKYVAYQIFTGTQAETAKDTDPLGDVVWGEDINSEVFLSALANAGEPLTGFAADMTAKQVAKHLGEINTAAAAEAFGKLALQNLNENANGTLIQDDTGVGKATAQLVPGYYVIEDQSNDTADGHVINDIVVEVVGDMEITAKNAGPSSSKKVKDVNDSTGETSDWQDSADYDIGDKVPYELTVKIPSVSAYDTYYAKMVDVISTGLSYNNDATITITGTEVDKETPKTVTLDSKQYEFETPSVADWQGEIPTGDYSDGNVLYWRIDDVIALANDLGITAPFTIKINYTATLTEDAKIGIAGNPNTFTYLYQRNPNAEGDGHTPWDTNIVFTFKADVSKVDDKQQPLDGAGFTLYKYYESAEGEDNWVAVGDEVFPSAVTGAEGNITAYTGEFKKGLDDGQYKIVETTTPPGFNTAEDIYFTIGADHDISRDNPALTGLTVKNDKGEDLTTGEGASFTVEMNKGEVATTVINEHGVELPETGGIGTTIFYVAGALLVAAAVVLLVTKRRVNGAEK